MGDFEQFVRDAEAELTRALAGHLPLDEVADAVAEAMAFAWEHRAHVEQLDNACGYLFRVAQSRSRVRRAGLLPGPDEGRLPEVEPSLGPAMRGLPSQQRSAVWLVHGVGWTYAEAAEAMGISTSAVGTHVARGLSRLRQQMGVDVGV